MTPVMAKVLTGSMQIEESSSMPAMVSSPSTTAAAPAVPPARLRQPWQRLLRIDEALLLYLVGRHGGRPTAVMRLLTRVGDTESWVVMVLGLAALGRPGVALAVRVMAGALGATVPVQVLKRFLRRARPDRRIAGFRALDRNPDAFSFPSGHTATAFGVAFSLLVAGSPLAAPAFVLAAGIGLSRVYLGAHYPLDVAVGALLGGVGGLISRWLLG
jgi:undecaprenyl-diphosphatase